MCRLVYCDNIFPDHGIIGELLLVFSTLFQGASTNLGLKFDVLMYRGLMRPDQRMKRSVNTDCVTITRRNSPSPVTPEQEEMFARVMKRTETALTNIKSVKKKLCPPASHYQHHYQSHQRPRLHVQDVDHQMSLFTVSW